MKKKKSLLHKFIMIFAASAVFILAVTGVATYLAQTEKYRQECEINSRAVGEFLCMQMKKEGEDFIRYQEYYMDHYRDMMIPAYISEWNSALERFNRLFAQEYPGMTLGVDIGLDELDDEVREAYYIYSHIYWLLFFEDAREAFDMPYTYYLVMDDPRSRDTGHEDHNVTYMIDGERTFVTAGDGNQYLYLGDSYYNSVEDHEIMWRTWETGQKQNGYKEWDNSWGHTYAYYTPLVINGRTIGLVTTEMSFASINADILRSTLKNMIIIAVILVLVFITILMVINGRFIKRIARLENAMSYYSRKKDSSIALDVEREFGDTDEVGALGRQFSAMILEINDYMENLTKTTLELEDTQQHAAEIMELTNKDALTGVRNRNAYDKEVQKIEWEISSGYKDFGVVVVDLNYLKRINETYGHEKGNMAIQKLCHLVCLTFAHSPVFRIGGDEFAVILRNDDFFSVDTLMESFNSTISRVADSEDLEYWEKTSAAAGFALFDPAIDRTYEDVFRRADEAMYERKKKMKVIG